MYQLILIHNWKAFKLIIKKQKILVGLDDDSVSDSMLGEEDHEKVAIEYFLINLIMNV
jgi:hypothetical protein